MFPFLNTRMDFSGEEEQHKVIHAALDAILALLSDPAAFDAAQAVALMGPLKEPLVRSDVNLIKLFILMIL